MKKILSYALFLSCSVKAQVGLFINGSDASLRVDTDSYISIEGDFSNVNCHPLNQVRFQGGLVVAGNFINNDTLKFFPGTTAASNKATLRFLNSNVYPTGTLAILGGSVTPRLWECRVEKNTGRINLSNNVICLDTLNFISGKIAMNGFRWNFLDPQGAPSVINHPFIVNERFDSKFEAASLTDTGLVVYNTIYTNSTNINPGNIGIEIVGPLNIGSDLYIKRGFKPQVNAAKGSILRYFDIESPGHALSANTITCRFNSGDIQFYQPNYFNPQQLNLYASSGSDIDWSSLSSVYSTIMNPPSQYNGVLVASLDELTSYNTQIHPKQFRITVADPNCTNPPVSSLTADTLHICSGDSVLLDAGNNTSVPNTSLKWEWMSPAISYDRTLTCLPANIHKKINLKLKDSRGCITRDSIVIAPSAPFPQIRYLNHLNACSGDSITLKDTVSISSGNYTNIWVFSDGDTLVTQKNLFRKNIANTGQHSYQLKSVSNHGCTTVTTHTNAIVYPLPSASFSSAYTCSSGVTQFSNFSVSNHTALAVTGHTWNFGTTPVNTSTLTNPSFLYTQPGNYVVRLSISSAFGCRDTTNDSLVILPKNVASFTALNNCFGDTSYFTNSSSCNTGTCSFSWKAGDGATGSTGYFKHRYNNSGAYTIKLYLTPTAGCADSSSKVLFIHPKPIAAFSMLDDTLCINTTGYFSNTSTISAGSINSYTWDYGNNNTGNQVNGSSTYTSPGIFYVNLVSLSDSGCAASVTKSLTTLIPPTASFVANTVCKNDPTIFISQSSGVQLTSSYDFGNGAYSGTVVTNPVNYTYSSAGTYTVVLIVEDRYGCSDTTHKPVTVLQSPMVNLGNTVATCGTQYSLTAFNPGCSYLWSPGNQTTATITVTQSGNQSVIVTSSNGCVNSGSVNIILNAIVKPILGIDTTHCGPLVLNAGYPGSTFTWNTAQNTQTISAANSGTFIVNVTDQNNCSGGDTVIVNILSTPVVDLGNNLSVCKPRFGLPLTATLTGANTMTWNTGNITSQIVTSSAGLFWIKATGSNGCTDQDTLQLTFLNTPNVNLGADRSSCLSVLLDAFNSGNTFEWNNSVTTQTLLAASTDYFHVTVTNTTTGCFQSDTVLITVHPPVKFTLGPDTTICSNTKMVLDAGSTGTMYNWLNGSNSQTTSVTGTGIYGVTVSNSAGCASSDYVTITVNTSPSLQVENTFITYLCNKPVLLKANPVTSRWQHPSGSSSISNSVVAQSEGNYKVHVTEHGCTTFDSVQVVISQQTVLASFLASTIDTINKPVQFVNLSEPSGLKSTWHFGDGSNSTDTHPLHTYVLPNTFSVTLQVNNGFCYDEITKEVRLIFRGEPDTLQHAAVLKWESLIVFPVPIADEFSIHAELNHAAKLKIELSDCTGRKVLVKEYDEMALLIDRLKLDVANGIYYLNVLAQSNRGTISRNIKLIKTN